jgi:hypothetical protein
VSPHRDTWCCSRQRTLSGASAFSSRSLSRTCLRSISRPAVPLARQVSEEHDPRFVGNHEFRTRLECDRLWRHPAGPEDRHLARMNGDGVAIVGSTQVGDPNGLWTAGVEGSAMGMRIACPETAARFLPSERSLGS